MFHLSYNPADVEGAPLRRHSTADRGRALRTSSRRALLTGFEAYNGAELNASGEVVRALDGSDVAGLRVVGRVLPVSAASAPPAVCAAIDEVAPEIVLMLGVWPGRHAFSIERVAVNVLDFAFPDNDGALPTNLPVLDNGPAAFLSTVPVKAVADAWRDARLPGVVSNTAGTYICNQSFYTALNHTSDSDIPVAFVHLPTLLSEGSRHDPPQVSMPLVTLVEGVNVALLAIATLISSTA